MLNKLSSEQREFLKKWYSDSSPSQLDDTEHIQGHELLEPPYNFTEDRILKDVREGKLVPWESPNADWIEKNRVTDIDEIMWRVFPDEKLQQAWLKMKSLQRTLRYSEELSQQTDEELISEHKQRLIDCQDCPGLLASQPDLETFIKSTLPWLRQRQEQNLLKLPSKIKDLKEKTAKEQVWKNIELTPTKKNKIFMPDLLNSYYKKDEVESNIKTPPKKQKPKTHDIREKVREKACAIWEKDKTITIADMVYKHLTDIAIKPKGGIYSEHTLRKWVKDLCPNRNPGRRPKN